MRDFVFLWMLCSLLVSTETANQNLRDVVSAFCCGFFL
jgi:hypothetical protein